MQGRYDCHWCNYSPLIFLHISTCFMVHEVLVSLVQTVRFHCFYRHTSNIQVTNDQRWENLKKVIKHVLVIHISSQKCFDSNLKSI